MNKKIAAVGLAVLVVGDIGLGYLAIRHVAPDAPNVSASPTEAFGVAQSSEALRGHPSRLLAVGDDGVILRASTGDCSSSKSSSAAEVEVSTDDGATFTTARKDIPQVLRVEAVSQTDLRFVDADGRCSPGTQRSSDIGTSWTRATGSKGSWHLSPGVNDVVVHAPKGSVDAGCVPVSVAAVNAKTAYIGCNDGRTQFTRDGGKEWKDLTAIDGLVGLTFSDRSTGFALAKTPDCAAAILSSTDAGKSWDRTACLKGDHPKAIASNAASGRMIAQVDNKVRYSDDNGATWTSAA